jgi:hypothetical protein
VSGARVLVVSGWYDSRMLSAFARWGFVVSVAATESEWTCAESSGDPWAAADLGAT